jgi:hypothetical protein
MLQSRILVVGNYHPFSSAFEIYQELKDLGHDVRLLRTNADWEISSKNIDQYRLYHRTKFFVNKRLKYLRTKFAERFFNQNDSLIDDFDRYDFIWVHNEPNLPSHYIQKLSEVSDNLIFYYPDNITKRHHFSKILSDNIGLYNMVVIPPHYDDDWYVNRGVDQVIHMKKFYFRAKKRSTKRRYTKDLSFIGSFEPERWKILESLIKDGLDIHIYGSNWQQVADSYPNHIHTYHVHPPERTSIWQDSKICLNFFRKRNEDQTNTRFFQIPAADCFMMSERPVKRFRYLTDLEECVYFSESSVRKDIEYFLENSDERDRIRQNGFDAVKQYKLRYSLEDILERANKLAD